MTVIISQAAKGNYHHDKNTSLPSITSVNVSEKQEEKYGKDSDVTTHVLREKEHFLCVYEIPAASLISSFSLFVIKGIR